MNSYDMQELIRRLREDAQDPGLSPQARARAHQHLAYALAAQNDYESALISRDQMVELLQEIDYRHPEFAGDMMGRPADDFD